jgi:hypothetical protein
MILLKCPVASIWHGTEAKERALHDSQTSNHDTPPPPNKVHPYSFVLPFAFPDTLQAP